jgi:hypothetical protein
MFGDPSGLAPEKHKQGNGDVLLGDIYMWKKLADCASNVVSQTRYRTEWETIEVLRKSVFLEEYFFHYHYGGRIPDLWPTTRWDVISISQGTTIAYTTVHPR